MKKRILAILLAILAVCLISCGGESAGDPGDAAVDADALVKGITEKYNMVDGYLFTSSSTELGEYLDESLISSYYGDAAEAPDFTKVESYCVYIDESDHTLLTDVGVFKMSDPSYADTFMKYLQARIDDKIDLAHTYTDIQVEKLKEAVIKKSGDYVYYTVGNDAPAVAAELADALK